MPAKLLLSPFFPHLSRLLRSPLHRLLPSSTSLFRRFLLRGCPSFFRKSCLLSPFPPVHPVTRSLSRSVVKRWSGEERGGRKEGASAKIGQASDSVGHCNRNYEHAPPPDVDDLIYRPSWELSVEKGSVDWLIIETIAEIEIRLEQRRAGSSDERFQFFLFFFFFETSFWVKKGERERNKGKEKRKEERGEYLQTRCTIVFLIPSVRSRILVFTLYKHHPSSYPSRETSPRIIHYPKISIPLLGEIRSLFTTRVLRSQNVGKRVLYYPVLDVKGEQREEYEDGVHIDEVTFVPRHGYRLALHVWQTVPTCHVLRPPYRRLQRAGHPIFKSFRKPLGVLSIPETQTNCIRTIDK